MTSGYPRHTDDSMMNILLQLGWCSIDNWQHTHTHSKWHLLYEPHSECICMYVCVWIIPWCTQPNTLSISDGRKRHETWALDRNISFIWKRHAIYIRHVSLGITFHIAKFRLAKKAHIRPEMKKSNACSRRQSEFVVCNSSMHLHSRIHGAIATTNIKLSILSFVNGINLYK